MKPVLRASIFLLVLSRAAVAAEPVVSEPGAPVYGFSWSGGYVGAQAGHVWGKGRFEGDGDHADPRPGGFLGGFYAGLNHQFGNDIVAGIEGDIALTRARDSVLVYNAAGIPWPADYPVVQEIKRTGALRARLGYAMDRWLPYFAGGIALASVDQRLVGADSDFNTTYSGWTLGLGIEYAFADNAVLRGEYRHADFGTKRFDVEGAPPLDIDLRTNDIRLGVAYKF